MVRRGDDTIYGQEGNDVLSGSGPDGGLLEGDSLDGGAGVNTVVESMDANQTLTNALLTVAPSSGSPGSETLANIQQAILTDGGASGNTLDASGFTSGLVTLVAGPGSDTLVGSPGNTTYVFADTATPGAETVIDTGAVGINTLDFRRPVRQ